MLEAYPCDLLFIHRDAEKQEPLMRRVEIANALRPIGSEELLPPHVCVIPIKMTEAWLLFNELAVRSAASNPNGTIPLNLPRIGELEDLPDPKQTLRDLLVTASELSGRRRKQFDYAKATRRIVEYLDDFSPLLRLRAFQELENDVLKIVNEKGWIEQ